MDKFEVLDIVFKKSEICITFKEESLLIDEEIYASHYFYVGKIFSKKEYDEIKEEAKMMSDYKYARDYMVHHPCTYSKDLEEKLIYKKQLSKDKVKVIIQKLKDNNLINDEDYANELVFNLNNKLYSYKRICMELDKKGIDEEVYTYQKSEELEEEKMQKLFDKLLIRYNKYPYNKLKEKINEAMSEYGYDRSNISSYVEDIKKEDDSEKLQKDIALIVANKDDNFVDDNKNQIINKLMRKGYEYCDIINALGAFKDEFY